MDRENNFCNSSLSCVYSGDPLDIPWVILCFKIEVNSTYGKPKVSLIEIQSILGIVKVFFDTLSNEWILFPSQIYHLACCVTERNYHNEQSNTSTDESLDLRLSLDIKGRDFLSKRVKTANVILCVPSFTLSSITSLTFVLSSGSRHIYLL